MPPLIFLGLILLILLWMLCTWMDERKSSDVLSRPSVGKDHGDAGHSGDKPLIQKKDVTLNKGSSYSSLKRQPKIREEKCLPLGTETSQNELPHDHTEHHPDIPDTLRPRRVVLARPPEEEEDEPDVKKSAAVQTDDVPDPVLRKSPKVSVGMQKGIEKEESTSQTDTSPLRASVGIQANVDREDVEIEALPHVTSRGSQAGVVTQDARVQTEEVSLPKVVRRSSSEQEPEDSFESYPLKPKYLLSPSQSEEESEQESSQSSGTMRQRYSILQPFMGEREDE